MLDLRRTDTAVRPGTRVGAVEPAALEDDADRIEQLAQLARALRAFGQRIVGERLVGVELVAALRARIRVGGHRYLRKLK
ncbi:hypothetical protein GCM10009624_19270 [Gordonia sinesedis]